MGETTPFDGYTLFQPLRSRSVYLVDMKGGLAHRWQTEYLPGQSVYMVENGHLLRAARRRRQRFRPRPNRRECHARARRSQR